MAKSNNAKRKASLYGKITKATRTTRNIAKRGPIIDVMLTGNIAEAQLRQIQMPMPFLDVCNMLGIPPDKIINDFMSMIGGQSTDAPMHMFSAARDFITYSNYGGVNYSAEDLNTMQEELTALSQTAQFFKNAKGDEKKFAEMRQVYIEGWRHRWKMKAGDYLKKRFKNI